MLAEYLESGASGVFSACSGERDYSANVVGAPIILGDDGRVIGTAEIVGAVEVVEGREREHGSLSNRMQP